MAGQGQNKASDGSHKVTVGSADDPKNGATAYVSHEDDQGNKQTTVYDKNHRVVKQVEKKKKK